MFLKVVGKNVFISKGFICFCNISNIISFFFFICLKGAPEMIVKMRKELKPVLVIEQNGKDFNYTMKTPIGTKVHSFSLGKESEMTAADGRKIKVIQG